MTDQPAEGERFEELPLVAVEAARDHELHLLGRWPGESLRSRRTPPAEASDRDPPGP